MSSKPKRITRPPPRTNRMPSTIGSGSNKKKTGNNHIPPRHPHTTKSDHSKSCQSGTDDEGGSSSPSTSSSNEGDGELRDSKDADAEAEELDEDDGDGDGLAPSGCTIKQDGKQAGPIIENSFQSLISTDISRKRRHDSSDVDISPRKALKRTREVAVLDDKSDDEDYAGVDLISDGEEGEPNVEQVEEKMIIDSEEENDLDGGSMFVPAPASDTSDDAWEGFDLDHGLFLSDIPYFDEQIGRTDPSELANDVEIFNAASFFDDIPFAIPTFPEQRRVRFAEPLVPSANASGTDSSELDEDTHPNPFPHWRMLNEGIDSSPFPHRRMLNARSQAKIGLIDRTPMWGGGENDWAFGTQGLTDDFEDSCGSSSGYETDDGETTEEDEQVTARRERLQRRDAMSSQKNERIRTSTPDMSSTPYSLGRRWGPRMGSWVADPTKPIALIDHTGKSLIILPAKRAVKSGKKSGLSHKSHGDGHVSNPVLASPETTCPFDRFTPGGSMLDDQDDDDNDEEDEGEALLDVRDFVDFGDDSDDSVGEEDGSLPSTIQSTPVKTHPSASFNQNLPSHFDKGVVTAFRRSQHEGRARRYSQEGPLARNDIFAARTAGQLLV